MPKKLLIYFFYLLPLISVTQNFVLTGNVVDDRSFPVSFSNVVLYNAENFTFVEGTTTNENGEFQFENLKPNNYTIIVSYLGFEENKSTINLDKTKSIGTIVLKEKIETLDGITVVAKRPTVNRLVDRLVFNVENSTLSNNNVLDVLKYTPGVLVHDGKITVKQSIPTVYINDKKVHLSISEIQQLLEGTSANNIKSIEVITNPSAKYDAEGGSVINIVTSKNIIAGYNGNVFGNYTQGSEYPKYLFGTSHFFKTKKLSTYLNYSIAPRKEYLQNTEFINFLDDQSLVKSIWETNFERTRKTRTHNIKANIEYELNDRNTLGFSTTILVLPRDHNKTASNSLTEIFDSSRILDSTFKTLNRRVDETFNLAFNLEYVHKFKKIGEKLSINVHHTNYDFSSFQNVNTDYFFPDESLIRNNIFQTFSSQNAKLYTGQIDYELPISNTSQFETGIKISNIGTGNIITQYVFENGVKKEDLLNSDTFLYDETNYAAYFLYSNEWNKWSLKSGLRTEYTKIMGNSLSTNQINNSKYIKFFPSLQIVNKLNDNNEIYFNYKKRIYRPRYSQLNPFKYFLNDNTYVIGDPNLKPQIDDVFTLGYTFNKNYTFELYYRNEANPTLQFIFQDNENKQIIYKNTNTDTAFSYGLDFTTYTKILPNWNLYLLSSFFYYKNKFFTLDSDELFIADKWSVYGEITNSFSFLKDKSLSADVLFTYISATNDGPTDTSSRSGLDISMRKSLWNDRASLNLGVTDIFNTQNFDNTVKYLNQNAYTKYRSENRTFTFGFTYKFGNSYLKNNKKQIDFEERDRLK
ncbi:outer membrane beta-barrel protein [Mariniflexile sp. HNIBRBA6329]|uniref:outer membrane beta-barrel protein n=1 Tax=Mariniflexile sp. HNIBRBA6329 TaxID=3373088 RepID=UPI003744E4D0